MGHRKKREAGRGERPAKKESRWSDGSSSFPFVFSGKMGIGRNQELFPVSNQVTPFHANESLSQDRPVARIMIPQERLVQPPDLESVGHIDFLIPSDDGIDRIVTCVKLGRGDRHGRRKKGLHLVGTKIVFLEPKRETEQIGRASCRERV